MMVCFVRMHVTLLLWFVFIFFLFHRQYFSHCAAEVTISGFKTIRSIQRNETSAVTLQRTDHLFIGGLAVWHSPNKVRTDSV